MAQNSSEPTFMQLVEFHERKWGTEQYLGRPTLQQLMNSQIVVMWRVGKRFIFNIYSDAQELNDLVLGLLTGQLDDPRKLAKIFVNQEPLDFRVKIISAPKQKLPEARLNLPQPEKTLGETQVLYPVDLQISVENPQRIPRVIYFGDETHRWKQGRTVRLMRKR